MSKVNYNALKPGDIGLVHSTGFIGRGIQLFMRMYKRKLGIPDSKLYNHAFGVVELWGKLFVVEAQANGINVTPVEVAYPEKRWSDIKVLTPKKAYNKVEAEDYNKVAVAYAFSPTRYGYSDLLFHMRAILSKGGYEEAWGGKQGAKAEKRMHCTEAVATWANKVRTNTFDRPWCANPVDLEYNKYYTAKDVLS